MVLSKLFNTLHCGSTSNQSTSFCRWRYMPVRSPLPWLSHHGWSSGLMAHLSTSENVRSGCAPTRRTNLKDLQVASTKIMPSSCWERFQANETPARRASCHESKHFRGFIEQRAIHLPPKALGFWIVNHPIDIRWHKSCGILKAQFSKKFKESASAFGTP